MRNRVSAVAQSVILLRTFRLGPVQNRTVFSKGVICPARNEIRLLFWFQVHVEKPETTDNALSSFEVDDVENALHEAFTDIFVGVQSERPLHEEVNENDRSVGGTDETETCTEQPENVSLPSILPLSIPCSVGSLRTPCAPVLDDLKRAPVSETAFKSLTPFSDEQLADHYQNKLLFGLQECTDEFNRTELKNLHTCEHPLNTLLQTYLHARLKLETAKREIKESKCSYVTHEKHIWTLEPATYTQYGECQVNIAMNP